MTHTADHHPGASSTLARQWLSEQADRQRELLLILDPLADPNPVQQLFGASLAQDYANLYLGTEFAGLSSIAPWLTRLPDSNSECLHSLLDNPKRNWGWLASVERFELSMLVQHWQERMLIEEEEGRRSLYRFQDNRVIAHHLAHLEADQRPLLMGPLAGALCWNGEAWAAFDNPAPGHYGRPFPTPWLEIADPGPVTGQVQHHNLLQWLWQQHPSETASLAESIHLDTWLQEQLAQAERWQWRAPEQVRFLLRHRLIPERVSHPAWAAQTGEPPEQHFLRCRNVIGAAASAKV
jgi:hypothetical protein